MVDTSQWYVYVLLCRDGSLYTGSTTDLVRRLKEHNEGGKLGAKYTRARRPVELFYSESCANRQEAAVRESAIKHLSREQKLALPCQESEI